MLLGEVGLACGRAGWGGGGGVSGGRAAAGGGGVEGARPARRSWEARDWLRAGGRAAARGAARVGCRRAARSGGRRARPRGRAPVRAQPPDAPAATSPSSRASGFVSSAILVGGRGWRCASGSEPAVQGRGCWATGVVSWSDDVSKCSERGGRGGNEPRLPPPLWALGRRPRARQTILSLQLSLPTQLSPCLHLLSCTGQGQDTRVAAARARRGRAGAQCARAAGAPWAGSWARRRHACAAAGAAARATSPRIFIQPSARSRSTLQTLRPGCILHSAGSGALPASTNRTGIYFV